eukprot:jgi/Mesvir1/6274/Mv19979-RA.1
MAALRGACRQWLARAPVQGILNGSGTGQQVRFLNIHEYQGAALMSKFGVVVPKGMVASTVDEAVQAAKAVDGGVGEVVVKSQVLAGGRGLGTFKNGFKGGVHIVKTSEAGTVASKMLGQTLVTKQTGEAGKPVSRVFIVEKLKVVNEMYLAMVLDRSSAGPVVIACGEGGTSIEELAEKHPGKIVKVPISVATGMTEANARAVVDGLRVSTDRDAAVQQVLRLYELFSKCDATLLEVNPLVETADKRLVAADAKINFDDNAAFRQKEIFGMRDTSQEDPREVEAGKYDLNYIGLDGEIGCMVNGAGLAMATMDIVKLNGGTPANFLDVGGNATEEQVQRAFSILQADPRVKVILVNIFGGIMKCDVIAAGIVAAAKKLALKVPLVVRLEGTNHEVGAQILRGSGLDILSAKDLDEAAMQAVKALKSTSK